MNDTRWEALDIEVETEQAVGGKRDDLRICGTDPITHTIELLITVEVKVAAGFHASAAEDGSDLCAGELTHQVLNYDRWLASQTAMYRVGAVLSRRRLDSEMPANLRCTWVNVTWTEFATTIDACLVSKPRNAIDGVLWPHVAGFIADRLWVEEGHVDAPLTFDEVALLRGFSALGPALSAKVDALVKPLGKVLMESGVCVDNPTFQANVFAGLRRSIVHSRLLESQNSPRIMTGMVTDEQPTLALWLEISPRAPSKGSIVGAIQQCLPALQFRDRRWVLPAAGGWRDIAIQTPVEEIFRETDQQAAVVAFVKSAIYDLLETGAIAAVREAFGADSGEATRASN